MIYFNKTEGLILLLFTYHLLLLTNHTFAKTPEIKFSAKDADKVAVRYGTTYFRSIGKKSFALTAECTATYPVQWKNVNSPFETKFPESRRDYKEWSDTRTYTFTTSMEIIIDKAHFTGAIEEFAYSCSSTSTDCLKDEIYIHSPFDDKDFVLVASNPKAHNLIQERKCNWINNYDVKVDPLAVPFYSKDNAESNFENSVMIHMDTDSYNWTDDDAPPLQITKQVSCVTNERFFSKGSILGIKMKNNASIHLLQANETRTDKISYYYETSATLSYSVNETIEFVYCFAPMWNTYGWWSLSTNETGIVYNSSEVLQIKVRKGADLYVTEHSLQEFPRISPTPAPMSPTISIILIISGVLVIITAVAAAVIWVVMRKRTRCTLHSKNVFTGTDYTALYTQ